MVTGVVVDENSRPLAGVLVFLDGGPAADSTDTAGVFRLDGVPAGPHLVSFRRGGMAPRSFNLELAEGEAGGDVGTVVLVEGPEPMATLRGRVTGAVFGEAVAGAAVEVNGEILGTTDESGGFDLSDVAVGWGSNRIRVRDPAVPESDTGGEFWVANPNETWEFSVALGDLIELAPVLVEAPPDVPRRLRPFYQRRERLSGQFLTRPEIEAREARNLTTLLGDLPGIRLRITNNGTEVHFTRAPSSFGACPTPLIFLDGVWMGGGRNNYIDLDEIALPEQVEGIEAYGGVAATPTEFSRLDSTCGVIVIWTR